MLEQSKFPYDGQEAERIMPLLAGFLPFPLLFHVGSNLMGWCHLCSGSQSLPSSRS
jgi:hypothetical protein